MSASELGQVEALLDRVLPDPKGFADRVFQQMVERLSSDVPGGETLGAVASHVQTDHDALADRNVLLAAAVGACDCWGQEPDCPFCSGEGSAGWTVPDSRLYAEYVEPAVMRSTEGKSAGNNPPDQPPTEGEP